MEKWTAASVWDALVEAHLELTSSALFVPAIDDLAIPNDDEAQRLAMIPITAIVFGERRSPERAFLLRWAYLSANGVRNSVKDWLYELGVTEEAATKRRRRLCKKIADYLNRHNQPPNRRLTVCPVEANCSPGGC